MSAQPPLMGRPDRRNGLTHTVVDDNDCVIDGAWTEARDTGRHVGTCRQIRCGQPLTPGEPYQLGPLTWYPATCVGCGAETTAHGPRPPRKKGKD